MLARSADVSNTPSSTPAYVLQQYSKARIPPRAEAGPLTHTLPPSETHTRDDTPPRQRPFLVAKPAVLESDSVAPFALKPSRNVPTPGPRPPAPHPAFSETFINI